MTHLICLLGGLFQSAKHAFFLTCNAAFSFEQVIEDETSYVSLLRRKPLKVNVDFKLDVLTDRVDSVRRLVFAQKIFLTSLEEPRKQIDEKL